jgi:hypothetical protein
MPSKNQIRKGFRYGKGTGHYEYLRGMQQAGCEKSLLASLHANFDNGGCNLSTGYVGYVRLKDGKAESQVAAQLVRRVAGRFRPRCHRKHRSRIIHI